MDFANSFYSMERIAGAYRKNDNYGKAQTQNVENPVMSFEDVLQQKKAITTDTTNLIFSKHANERLATRNIQLNEEQMNRLNQGVKQAKEKSINESLVMMDNIAFIVNIKNNTVVTAMDQETNQNNVFTNIDGAVIV